MIEFSVIYFLTHPIQYQAPLLKALQTAGERIHVLYASTDTTWGEDDWKERIPLVWDVPLLEGYPYERLPGAPPAGGFWAQVQAYRRTIRFWLSEHPTKIAWIHGWGNPYALAALLEARRAGATVFLRGESHLDCLRGPWWRRQAHWLLLSALFRRIDHFLAIGAANRKFYEAYGVGPERITPMPYVVDNAFFQNSKAQSAPPADSPFHDSDAGRPVVLYAGKLAYHKGVDLLIEAVAMASCGRSTGERPRLIVVGEGDRRAELEKLADRLLPGDVWFAGFRNQTAMPSFYAMADVFVLPSRFEPWGLVVNEAMNSGKPVVVSDRVGARHDLVRSGQNGSVFNSGDAGDLATKLEPLLWDAERRTAYGRRSLEIINRWGLPEAVHGWKEAVATLPPARTAWGVVAAPSSEERPPLQSPSNSLAGTISVSYAYVHNAYQQAQAAAEAGALERFYCSCIDGAGQWGRWIGRFAGKEVMASRGGVTLPACHITEHPWPLMRSRLQERLEGSRHHDWIAVSAKFDRWVAGKLDQDPCDLLLCYETGARDSFLKAREMGKQCLLDCPQFHPTFLWNLLAEAADRCDMPPPPPIDTPETAARKGEEFALAHELLVYSPLHAKSFTQVGFKPEQVHIAPLWIDPALWYPEARQPRRTGTPLRLLFVGGASLRKGIPFLLQAMKKCGNQVRLTLAGEIDEFMAPLVAAQENQCTFIGPQTKPALRRLYAAHDLLVLPSVADAFGFVAMEAMACGLPVLVSDKCGVPVPDETWRIPALDSVQLEDRFRHYCARPEATLADGATALHFAKGFTATTFRHLMRECFALALSTSPRL